MFAVSAKLPGRPSNARWRLEHRPNNPARMIGVALRHELNAFCVWLAIHSTQFGKTSLVHMVSRIGLRPCSYGGCDKQLVHLGLQASTYASSCAPRTPHCIDLSCFVFRAVPPSEAAACAAHHSFLASFFSTISSVIPRCCSSKRLTFNTW